jgi:hypothetical protein
LTKWLASNILLQIMSHNKEITQYSIPLRDRLRNTFTSVKGEARDLAACHQLKRRDVLTGLAATGIVTAFGTDAVFTWNRMSKKVEELDKQLPRPPEKILNEAVEDVKTFDSLQRLTDNRFQEGMSQEALEKIQEKENIVEQKAIYDKKRGEQVGPEQIRLLIDSTGIMGVPVAVVGKEIYER